MEEDKMEENSYKKIHNEEEAKREGKAQLEEAMDKLKHCSNFCLITIHEKRTCGSMGVTSDAIPYMLRALERTRESLIKALCDHPPPMRKIEKENDDQELG